MAWNDGLTRPVTLGELGQRYRQYRLADPDAVEAWVVQGLVRDDGMTQVEAAHLLGRHKSWVCRRLALLEKLSAAVKADLRLGLVGPSLARQLTRLPVGNQEALLALARRATLTMPEVSGVIDLLVGASAEQAAFVLAKPREALAQVQGMPAALCDPRLSRAGNWLARHLRQAQEALVRVENWLRTPNERELHVVYRHIGVDGYLTHRSNLYSVPFSHIGQVLPVRITESEVIIYSVRLEEITRHPLVPRTQTGVRQLIKTHHPVDDPIDRTRLLRERFNELGPVALQFFDGLLTKQIQGKLQAQQLLALIAQYPCDDVRAAFERAVRFGAFSLAAIRRILAATAKPKQWPDELANLHDTLPASLRDDPIGPRPTSDYQQLLLPEEPSHETPSQEEADPDQPKPA